MNTEEKVRLTDTCHNPKIQLLALRLLGRHYPDALSPAQKMAFNQYLQRAHRQADGDLVIDLRKEKKLNAAQALQEIIVLRGQPEIRSEQHALLTSLEEYLRNLNNLHA